MTPAPSHSVIILCGEMMAGSMEGGGRRDGAVEAFERVQQKSVDELEQRTTMESRQIQEEMDKLVAEHRARIQANADAVAKERERFYTWRLQKQQEEQKIAETVSHFVTENPITRGLPPDAPTPGKGQVK